MVEKKKTPPVWGALLSCDPAGVARSFALRKFRGVVAHPVGGKILVLGYREIPSTVTKEAVPAARSYDGGDFAVVVCGADGRPLPRKGGWWIGDHCEVVASLTTPDVLVQDVRIKNGRLAKTAIFEGHVLRCPRKFLAAVEAGFRWLAHAPETRGKDCYVAGGVKKPHVAAK